VENLKWVGVNGEKASNSLGIEDFCGYKYVIYTEVRIFFFILVAEVTVVESMK